MARVKRGVTSHAKHKKVLKAAKGFYGRRKNTIRIAKQAVEKANQYAFRDRKRRKRTFRALWIQRLERGGASVRPELQPVHRRTEQVGPRDRPQGAVGSRDPRAGGVPGDRREGQGRSAGPGANFFLVMPGDDAGHDNRSAGQFHVRQSRNWKAAIRHRSLSVRGAAAQTALESRARRSARQERLVSRSRQRSAR